MADIRLLIPPPVRESLAAAIDQAGGNEVFFLARLAWDDDSSARVAEVDVAARGNRGAAPAIIKRAEEWDLAIHNHPSGHLEPSEADLGVAHELANREVGFAIIDNRAERHYLVVPPFRKGPHGPQPVAPAEVEAVFGSGGPLAGALADYEARAGQVAMAREVAEALNGDRVVALEAGTGVGKSFGYLVPAILWSVRNRSRVIVSTNTINLQEQLIGKDLPFLERVLPVKFRYALIKGRGNYACKRKLAEIEKEGVGDLVEIEDEARQLRDLIAWAKVAREGSLAELGAPPPERVWEKAMSETDKSLKVNCPFYGECFYYQAKRAAFKADIVVVNHHLFFADLAVRRVIGNYQLDLIVPGYERVVFDEAHHLEDIASQYLGVRISQLGFKSRFGRLVSPRDRQKGVLPHLAKTLRREGAPVAAERLERGLLADLAGIAARIDEQLSSALELAKTEAAKEGGEARESGGVRDPQVEDLKLRLTDAPAQAAFRDAIDERLRTVSEEIGIVVKEAERVIRALEKASSPSEDRLQALLLEPTSLRDRMAKLRADLEFFRSMAGKGHVRWIEVRGRRGDPRSPAVTFASAPIRVADDLKSAVYDPVRTVVMTSATLSVEGSVSYLGERLGLDQIGEDRFRFGEFPSPFDYPRQVLTLVPDDFPDPGSGGYEEAVRGTVLEVLLRSRGRAFVLFTSYRLLTRTCESLRGPLAAAGIGALRQGETGRTELLERFREGPPRALFGTDSFWEGVDVKGEALSCVIITRLPFRVPSEPLQMARAEDLRERGSDPFASFTVPQAVLKFKQGFGRLIRSASDRGVVVVLDRRIITKPYGRAFLRSLPPTRFVRGDTRKVLQSLGEFFSAGAS